MSDFIVLLSRIMLARVCAESAEREVFDMSILVSAARLERNTGIWPSLFQLKFSSVTLTNLAVKNTEENKARE